MLALLCCFLVCAAQLSAFNIEPIIFEDNVSVANDNQGNSVKALLNVIAEPYCGLADGNLQTQLLDVQYGSSNRAGEVLPTNITNDIIRFSDGSVGIPYVDIEAGPIWNNDHAGQVCPGVCEGANLVWNGGWTTTIWNEMSVCSCDEPNNNEDADEKSEIEDRAGGVNEAQCQKAFCDAMLSQHNAYRARHRARAMTMDQGQSKSAQQWARELARKGHLEHNRSGQNLAMFGGQPATLQSCTKMGKVMTDMWYNEIKFYDFNHQGFTMKTGHFTQVVWKGSTRLGCGVSISNGNKFWGVGHYDPPGNVIGQFERNVSPRS